MKTRAKPIAFTLIELLVTLVIVSVLAAATLPAFKNVIVERKTSVAALEVKAFFDAARARAISRGRPVSVILERLSSRWDGTYPILSSTANNAPSGVLDNYDVYNTCIRLVMAESLRSIEYDISVNIIAEDMATGSSQVGNDNDNVLEPCRILSISNLDARLARDIAIGNEIELVDQNEQSHVFRIKLFTISGPNYIITIDNEGNTTRPFGTIGEINTSASSQSLISLFTNLISPMPKFRIRSVPRPIASMVTELPKGSCIDLSLSGLSHDDPNVNPAGNLYRDCRREFASDWVLPPIPAFNTLPPIPSQLRPVYLTFGPTGKLSSVLCNAPQALPGPTAGSPGTYTSNLRRIEPQSDVCLFVGRTDQVIATANAGDLAAAEDTSLKPNLLDASGYWVRVSPSSGIISAAPAQSSHIIEDVADFRAGSMPKLIGDLLEDSRSLIFGAELTSQ